MNEFTARIVALGLLALLLISCGGSEMSFRKFKEQYDSLELTYFSGDIIEAESAMHRVFDLVAKYDDTSINAADYPKIRWLTHLRLFRLLVFSGREQEAEDEMASALSEFRHFDDPEANRDDDYLRGRFKELLQAVEMETMPAWKRPEPEAPNNPVQETPAKAAESAL